MERFTGCKVFSATLARDRDAMSDTINNWLGKHPELEIVDKTVSLFRSIAKADSNLDCN